jgi:predicted nuclease of predicted toxin-antitoxin system
MLRLLTDEDFIGPLLQRLLKARPSLDIVRVQDVGLRTKDDALILEWAAREDRVVLTHDNATMRDTAYERVVQELRMPGVIIVSKHIPHAQAVDDILLIVECSLEGELENQVRYVPVRY